MSKGNDYPPTEMRTGRVTLAIIFPGMPVREIFAPMRAHMGDLANLPVIEPALDLAQARVKTELAAGLSNAKKLL